MVCLCRVGAQWFSVCVGLWMERTEGWVVTDLISVRSCVVFLDKTLVHPLQPGAEIGTSEPLELLISAKQ